jgi:hypothetical protein
MQGPDYTHWHGLYDVSQKFYFKFIPELIHLAAKHDMTEKYQKAIDDILARPEHKWYKDGFESGVMKAIQDEQEERYKQ